MRRGAFPGVYRDVSHYAVWLYDVRRLHYFAHAIFRWLLVEVRDIGDAENLRITEKNVRCFPA